MYRLQVAELALLTIVREAEEKGLHMSKSLILVQLP